MTPTSAAGTGGPGVKYRVAMDGEGRIAADLPCRDCGYLLRTQRPEGRCPECDLAVATSLAAQSSPLMDRDWLRNLQVGAGLLAVALPCLFAFFLGGLAWILGIACLLTNLPAGQKNIVRLRKIVLLSLAGAGLTAVGFIGLIENQTHRWVVLATFAATLGCAGVHVGGVLRIAVVFCRHAEWRWLGHAGNTLAVMAWVSPFAVLGGLQVMALSFGYAWGGRGSPPLWLDVMTYLAVYGGLAAAAGFLAGHFVFWLTLAIRLHGVRKQAEAATQPGGQVESGGGAESESGGGGGGNSGGNSGGGGTYDAAVEPTELLREQRN
ncbi:MAG: hypothetical protein AAGG38_15205 [Planctomycetota bacterium]